MLGAVVGAHGVSGALRVKSFTDDLARFTDVELAGRQVRITRVRPAGQLLSVSLDGLTTRDAAEALRGETISVPRTALPTLDEGEYYHADLIGLPVVDEGGQPLGTVVAVDNFGASDVIEIERPDGTRFMVPMIADAVPDWSGDRLVVAAAFAQS